MKQASNLHQLDRIVIILFFGMLVVLGVWSFFKNKDSKDYYVAGGKLPWWLSGISHHVSGYSGAVFVAYAGLAYTHGFSLYVWWAFTVGLSILVSVKLFPIRWVRLRKRYNIQSPLEYVSQRYNLPAQQLMAWSGVLLKLFDVGAKWAAMAILLKVFTGLPMVYGILISGGVSLIYITLGGLWAVILTDFSQFIVQIIAGIVMFVVVLKRLGGFSAVTGLWDQLPEANGQLFNEPYTMWFMLAFLFLNFLSYNGGTWSLATRYISSPDEKSTKKAALLSGSLYLIWPLILFFPMWAAPVLLPGLEDPTESYGLLSLELLPKGLIGLVLASMFANTMSMTSSDANTISAVITRDILPSLNSKFKDISSKKALKIAWLTTFIFTSLTIIVALQQDHFGGVLGLIVQWFGALVGPIAIPMLFGMIPIFKKSDSIAAITSIIAGVVTFTITRFVNISPEALKIALPTIISFIFYVMFGVININKKTPEKVEKIINSIKKDSDEN